MTALRARITQWGPVTAKTRSLWSQMVVIVSDNMSFPINSRI